MTHSPLRLLKSVWSHIHLMRRGKHPVYLDYPLHQSARYGWGKPPHGELEALLARNVACYEDVLERLTSCAEGLRRIPVESVDDSGPYWSNGYIEDLDAAMLYGFPQIFESKRYVEIGSGNSTKFVRQARIDSASSMEIVSIDPSPRAHVDPLCDVIHRCPLEAMPLDVFDSLQDGDILMVDGSHRCFQNSDVTVLFLEILPRLRPGVIVYFDDIFLPRDYPPEWEGRHYSEQYLLAVLLLADRGRRYDVLFPGSYSCQAPRLARRADRFWSELAIPGFRRSRPNGFWLRVDGAG